jgi:hypothetical protein
LCSAGMSLRKSVYNHVYKSSPAEGVHSFS